VGKRHADCCPEGIEIRSNAMEDSKLQAVEDAYRQLVKGLGRELVTDDNVDALIRRAEQDGHSVLATELREWQAPCGMGEPARAPTAGFNKDHVKH
jgi:hypothetical protein